MLTSKATQSVCNTFQSINATFTFCKSINISLKLIWFDFILQHRRHRKALQLVRRHPCPYIEALTLCKSTNVTLSLSSSPRRQPSRYATHFNPSTRLLHFVKALTSHSNLSDSITYYNIDDPWRLCSWYVITLLHSVKVVIPVLCYTSSATSTHDKTHTSHDRYTN